MNRASKCNTGLILSFALTTVSAHATTINPLAQNSDAAGPPASTVQAPPPVPASENPGDSPHLSENSLRTDDAPNADLTFFSASDMGDEAMKLIDPTLISSLDAAPDFSPATYFVSIIADPGNGGLQPPAIRETASPSGPVPEPLPVVMTGTGLLALWGLQKRHSHLHSSQMLC